SALGGADGLTDTDADSFGSLAGSGGIVQTGIAASQTPGVRSGAECALADLNVTDTGTPNPVTPTNNITYTQVITNSGPQDAVNAAFTEQVPANTTFVSLSAVAGWTCVTPAVGATGTITCTNPNFTNGGNASFTLVVKVNAGVASGTVVTDVASVTSGTNDPNFGNNTATVQTVVSAATAADESITVSATPNPVAAGGTITYTVVAMNSGPAAAVQPVITFPVVGPSTFQSLTPPVGWTCINPGVGNTGSIVCRIGSLAAGGNGTFTIVTAVPAGTAGGTVIATTANIGCLTPDPTYANNTATTTEVVAAAGQADVGITGTVSPNPVLAGNNITYLLTVTNNGPSPTSAAAVMVTDTLPAGVTFVSATPTAGSCGFAAGVITCSLGTLAAGASVNITVVDKVNAATAPGTTISSTFAESSTTSDPNAASGMVMLSTIVAVPNDADVSVTKTGSPNPVNLNTTLVYTIQVRNNGPAVATNVMVTDTLPAAVTYVSSSSTQGTCTQAGGTVTCNNIGTMSVGQLVVVTITVTATTFSSGTLATNTVTITHSDPDSSSANNTATFTSTIQASTAVELASFEAKRLAGGGVMVEWQTREESHNLGFHLYRLQNGTKTRLDPSLIAGAALMFRGGLPQHGAKTYRWLDASAGAGEAQYELESVEVDGTRATHGPAVVDESAPDVRTATAAAANSRTLAQANGAMTEAVPTRGRTAQALPAAARGGQTATVTSGWLAARQAVKISIQHEGWYQVTHEQLLAAGMPRGTDVRSLHLYAEGVEQAFQADGSTGGSAGIEFYGTGIDTPFSDTRVYWLANAAGAGEAVGTANPGRASNTAAASFPFATVREDHTTYFAALLNGEDNDNFFGALVSTTPVEQDLTATNNDPQFTGASLGVALQGATNGQAHRVSVSFNGIYLGEIDFFGFGNQTQTFPLAAGQVVNGTNAVELTSLAGDNDYSLVQSITLVYGHRYAADGNWLRMTARGGDALEVTGFTNPQIRVYDITNPQRINQVAARVSMAGGAYSVAFTAPGGAGHTATLVAFSADQIEAPAGLEHHSPAEWGRAENSADVVIITHADFADSLTPLVNLRRRQGHRVAVVPVDDLYDEFNYGERSPYAVQNFLAAAEAHWKPKPQSVLLVGDASLDPRNYLGLGDFDFVPTRIIETAALKTASDDWFSDFAGKGFATMATGRLPVRTSAEAANVVGKIVGYETGASPGPWTSQALLVGDQNRDYDFTSATNGVEQLLPAGLGVTKILADGQDPSVVHQQLVEAMNSGQVIVNFLGHGSVEQWSLAGYFADADATSLTNGGNLPFVVSMDCLSGFFQDVYTTSLAESLLLAPEGGAVAVWASSGFTTADPQATMDRALVGELAANPSETLGAAIQKTKAGTTDQDVRRTWILFGDPAMRLRLPSPANSSAKR
ncbi:MAG TPA: C25 family cysteine peptidase, partial [Candidatus Acidoferrales bacterium]|nr:C25 family cysteine peptidase [Candidatus Acidoferrales bacterium]